MADADINNLEDQDQAEVFDEINLLPERDRMKGGDDGLTFDTLPDVFDSTYARGDNDVDGDDEALNEDEESDELLDTLADRADSDEDNLDNTDPVDALDADSLTDATLAVDFEDNDIVDGVDRLALDEVQLIDVADADTLGGAVPLTVSDLESDRVSDADLIELGYEDPATGKARGGAGEVQR